MANKREIILGIIAIVSVAVLFIIFYLWGYLSNLTGVIEGILIGYVFLMIPLGITLIYYGLKPKNFVVLTPLPHYKGYMLRLEWEISDVGQDTQGQTLHKAVLKPQLISHPDANLLASSQKLEVYYGKPNEPQKELIAKFGVIRVHCISGEAVDCRVEVKVKLIEEFLKPKSSEWRDVGYLNWYSVALKREAQKAFANGEDELKGLGLNRYLKNTTESLHKNESKDLLLFYMIKDASPSNVFICTDLEAAQAGLTVEGKPLKFQVELTVTAEKYLQIFKYFVVAKWDDYQITPI